MSMHAYRFSTTKPFMLALKHTNTVLALYCIQNFAVIHERGAYIRLAVIIVYIVCYRRDSIEYSALPPPFHPPRPSDQRTRCVDRFDGADVHFSIQCAVTMIWRVSNYVCVCGCAWFNSRATSLMNILFNKTILRVGFERTRAPKTGMLIMYANAATHCVSRARLEGRRLL